MHTVIIQHDVQDYATWKAGFDAHQPARAAAGVKHHVLGTVAGSPNTVVLISDWDKLEDIRAFFENPGLAEAMKNSGVIGQPSVLVLENTEHGHY